MSLKTIQSKLFLNYTIAIALTIVVFTILFYFYTSGIMEKKASESIYQLSNIISQQMDNELDKIDTLQKKILFSETAKSLIFSNPEDFQNNNLDLQRKFNDLINLVSGPDDFRKYQINIYNLNGSFVGIGQNHFLKKISSKELESTTWIKDALTLDGKKLITPPYTATWWKYDTAVISMFRSFSEDNTSKSIAVIDVQVDYQSLKNIIAETLNMPASSGDSGRKIVILDSQKHLIYSQNENKKNIVPPDFYLNAFKSNNNHSLAVKIENPYSKSSEMVSGKYSNFSGWTVLVIESESILLKPVVKLRNSLILLGVVAILLTMLVTYFIARNISNPIKRIHKSLKNLSLDALPENLSQNLSSGILEIEDLNRVYNEMCKKLKISLDQVVSARSHELQSRLLAMQSQMNPHFLYNTLSIIKIMGKEVESNSIIQICTDLSKMLRYISDSSTTPVRLGDEIDHTLCYLNLMKVRYQQNLIFEVNIPDKILEICLPKLIVQPLVENCIKYTADIYPPWIITIDGKVEDNLWYISVSDNGKGFDKVKLAELKEKFSNFNPEVDFPATKMDGMGIINIFARLKILYRDLAIFEIGQTAAGGAIVTIGGPLLGA